MNRPFIAVPIGDPAGIGPEIVNQAVKVLDKTAEKFGFAVEYDPTDIGGIAIDNYGEPLPQITIDKCKDADSVMLGAVGVQIGTRFLLANECSISRTYKEKLNIAFRLQLKS